MESYNLEKWIWTQDDVSQMGWHDATVYGLKLDGDLVLDLDYIFQWNQPEVEGFYFTFWVAPCTLIFQSPTDLSFELTQPIGSDRWIEIDDIDLVEYNGRKKWTIITQQGDISFYADSFKQLVRRRPTYQLSQKIDYDEREGFSFDSVTGENLTHQTKPEILSRKKKEFEAYQFAKRRFVAKKELDDLYAQRESGKLDTKEYLLQKKAIKEKIDYLNFELRGTHYHDSER